MSDFLAVVAINGTVLNLVDWDKPCWFRADSPNGERVIPHPEFFLTDALALLAADEFDLKQEAQFPWRRDCVVYNLTEAEYQGDLVEMRRKIRAKRNPSILISYFGKLDFLLTQDVSKLSLEVLTAPIDESNRNKREF